MELKLEKKMQKLLKTSELAKILGLSESTLKMWRCYNQKGPKWIKIGPVVRYREEDVKSWLEELTDGCK